MPIAIAVVVFLLGIGGAAFFPPGPFLSYWIGSMIGVALGLMKLADVVVPFRPRFADLTR